jgi:hypothetical protein
MPFLVIKFIVLAILFIITGNIFRNKIVWYDDQFGRSFWFAADFFIGYALFFSVIRIATMITDSFKYMSVATIFAALIFCSANYKKISLSLIEFTKLILFLLSLFFVLYGFVLIYWIQNNLSAGPFAIIGSLHSPRYFNIIHFILKEDTIPVLGQNYAQTVIAALPLLFGEKLIFLSLSILLALVLTFSFFMVYGLFKCFSDIKWFRIAATVLVLCGATTFGLQYFLFVDSGWPLFINGYSDSIVGIMTFFLMVLLVSTYLLNTNGLNKIWLYTLIYFTLLLWMASAIQNLFFLVLFAFAFLISKWNTNRTKINARFGILITLIALSIIIGLFSGSMITPSLYQKNKEEIPGMMSIKDKKKPFLQVQPGFIYLKYDGAEVSEIMVGSAKWVFRENNTRLGITKYGKFFFATGVRVLIFPFLIICIIGWYLRKSKSDVILNKLWKVTLLLFGTGFILIFPFAILGYKSELSRFLIPGLFFNSVLLCFGMHKMLDSRFLSWKKILVLFIILLLLLGPIFEAFDIIRTNLFLKNFTKNLTILNETLSVYVR